MSLREYTVITVPQDLLPQIVGELLAYAADPNYVEVVDDVIGRVIHAHPQVADVWFEARTKTEEAGKSEPAPDSDPAPAPEASKKTKPPLTPNSEERTK